MATYTIDKKQLTPKRHVLVRGKVAYCHVTSYYEGDDLARENARRVKNGQQAKDTPYVSLTIGEPQIVPREAGKMSLEEQYVMERFYTSTAKNTNGYAYSANKNKPADGRLPYIAVARPDNPSIIDQVQPEGELVTGLDVTIVLRTYSGTHGVNFSFDGIIVNEPIRYYNAAAALSEYGITFNPLPDTIVNNETDDTTQTPQPIVNPYAQPVDQPFSTNPTNQQPTAAPASQPPMPNPVPVQPVEQTPPENPLAQNTSGIRYNPANPGDNNRSY